MTTYVQFVPSNAQAFQFQATLDNALYTVIVTWNIFAERYYINIYDVNNTLILCRALTASGILISGTFTWANSYATAALSAPHNIQVGNSFNALVSDTGAGYDGQVIALSTGATSFSYPLADNPGVTGSGYFSQDVDLVAGYFTSTLVFRQSSQQFEID